ncbi:MAG: ureidoglycolate lyase [Microcoleaceae cyanobacterium]
MNKSITIETLLAQEITSENFKLYGQVITPSQDGKLYDKADAQLSFEQGIPRFYIMRLQQKGLGFHQITRHNKCTQCLGSLEGKEWFIAVAPPSLEDKPNLEQLTAFRISGNCFIRLEIGTWHAGPYFDQEFVDFYNLELSDTNVVDHFTYNFLQSENLQFEIVS